ncbi:MAG: Ni/Fe-hydrogenase cytochrome b subunit [Myxococcales bacterium]|nr:Ni/Fe-hydrogenase cytochrome b subunit [Myxococcales bacterium]
MSAAAEPRPDEAAPIGGRIWSPFIGVLALLVGVAGAVIAVRFLRGLGAVTNLSDGYPWGLWIAYDDVIGSALGASGFTVAFVVYILNRGQYHPMVRPALLTALFGYLLAGASVVIDLGRYWDFWHVFLPRYAQWNSVLLGVSLCMTAYTLVLFLELMPVVLEKLGWKRTRQKIDRLLFVVVAIGVVLPTIHQASLGSMLLVFGPQIDPLYQTQLLPVLFLSSTMGMGLAAVVIESSVTSLALRRPVERELLTKLMKVGQVVAAAFVVARFIDLAVRGQLGGLVVARPLVLLFWIETALFAAPVVLLWGPASHRPARVFVAAMAMAVAGILYRLDAYLVAYDTGAGWHYFPSLGELVVTIGLIAFEILAFIIAIRVLPVLPKLGGARAAAGPA